MITRSDRLDHVHSDIRGPLYQEALRMESEGVNVLKLNTGNPGRFGFKLPNSVRQALALHIDEAVPYCDVRGMAAARNVICTYHIGRGLQGIMPNDVFICNGVSEAASMLMNALIGTAMRFCCLLRAIRCGAIMRICAAVNPSFIAVTR